MKRCPRCNHKLVNGDYGYYCDNKKCNMYDKEILVYGKRQKKNA